MAGIRLNPGTLALLSPMLKAGQQSINPISYDDELEKDLRAVYGKSLMNPTYKQDTWHGALRGAIDKLMGAYMMKNARDEYASKEKEDTESFNRVMAGGFGATPAEIMERVNGLYGDATLSPKAKQHLAQAGLNQYALASANKADEDARVIADQQRQMEWMKMANAQELAMAKLQAAQDNQSLKSQIDQIRLEKAKMELEAARAKGDTSVPVLNNYGQFGADMPKQQAQQTAGVPLNAGAFLQNKVQSPSGVDLQTAQVPPEQNTQSTNPSSISLTVENLSNAPQDALFDMSGKMYKYDPKFKMEKLNKEGTITLPNGDTILGIAGIDGNGRQIFKYTGMDPEYLKGRQAINSTSNNAAETIKLIDDLLARDLSAYTGLSGTIVNNIPGFGDVQNIVDQLKARFTLEKLAELKQLSKTGASGFGSLSNAEGEKLAGYLGMLNLGQLDGKSVKDVLNNIKRQYITTFAPVLKQYTGDNIYARNLINEMNNRDRELELARKLIKQGGK